jgi:hypothetical protein
MVECVEGINYFVPTRKEVEELREGDAALDCFGKLRRVMRITYRGVDIYGRAYVGFYTAFGENGGSISHSYKEGELVRTVALSNRYTSAECDRIEQNGGRPCSR